MKFLYTYTNISKRAQMIGSFIRVVKLRTQKVPFRFQKFAASLARSEMRMPARRPNARGIAICLGDNLELASGKWMASRRHGHSKPSEEERTEWNGGVSEDSIILP